MHGAWRAFPCQAAVRCKCSPRPTHGGVAANGAPRCALSVPRFRRRRHDARQKKTAGDGARAVAVRNAAAAASPGYAPAGFCRPAFAGRLLPAGYSPRGQGATPMPLVVTTLFAPLLRCSRSECYSRRCCVVPAVKKRCMFILFAPAGACGPMPNVVVKQLITSGQNSRSQVVTQVVKQRPSGQNSRSQVVKRRPSGQKQPIASGQTASEWSKQPIASGQTAAEWSKTADGIAAASGLAFTYEIAGQNRRSKSPGQIGGPRGRAGTEGAATDGEVAREEEHLVKQKRSGQTIWVQK